MGNILPTRESRRDVQFALGYTFFGIAKRELESVDIVGSAAETVVVAYHDKSPRVVGYSTVPNPVGFAYFINYGPL